uniref:Uncharacterized protein n=1 Tax=Timema monikensis TaxID=170555 RepID=A0A7R9E3V5_9NEOP|nr:unnamed protein product [Timema monikensis]
MSSGVILSQMKPLKVGKSDTILLKQADLAILLLLYVPQEKRTGDPQPTEKRFGTANPFREETTLTPPKQDVDPIIGSIVYCESDALYHAATEVSVECVRVGLMNGNVALRFPKIKLGDIVTNVALTVNVYPKYDGSVDIETADCQVEQKVNPCPILALNKKSIVKRKSKLLKRHLKSSFLPNGSAEL